MSMMKSSSHLKISMNLKPFKLYLSKNKTEFKKKTIRGKNNEKLSILKFKCFVRALEITLYFVIKSYF